MVKITPEVITQFRDQTVSEVSPVTMNNRLKILRVIFKQAWRDGVLQDNPAAKVPILKITPEASSSRRAFTEAELSRLLRSAKEEWQGLIRFGLYTGQRLGDLVRLHWENIDLERGSLAFTTRKTGRRQILPMAPPLREWLEGRAKADGRSGPVFPESFGVVSREGKVSTLSRQFYDFMASEGMVPVKSHKKQRGDEAKKGRRQRSGLSFHSLRHTATSLMKNAGISPAIVQEFVGHDSKAISDHYTHIEFRALEDVVSSLPNLSRGDFSGGEDGVDSELNAGRNQFSGRRLCRNRIFGHYAI